MVASAPAPVRTSGGIEVAVRPLRFDEMLALHKAVWDSTSLAQIEARWRERELGFREIYVADAGGALTGTVSIHEPVPGSMHLFALDVGPAWRNRGIGRALIDFVVAEAARRGLREVFLEVRVDNPARRLYHRAGFRRVGQPFENGWWRYDDEGGRERVEEMSLRMVRRIRRRS
jgi:ribosomal protein S18 acetylase RimI-like enzyme